MRLDPRLTLELAVTARHPLSRLGPERLEFAATPRRTMGASGQELGLSGSLICYRFVTPDVALTVAFPDLPLMKGHEQCPPKEHRPESSAHPE